MEKTKPVYPMALRSPTWAAITIFYHSDLSRASLLQIPDLHFLHNALNLKKIYRLVCEEGISKDYNKYYCVEK